MPKVFTYFCKFFFFRRFCMLLGKNYTLIEDNEGWFPATNVVDEFWGDYRFL